MSATSTSSVRRALCVLALVAAGSTPAHAGWERDGAVIRSTSAFIAQVAAVNDGGRGTLVAWQEGVERGGFLLVQHVLPSGDPDPAWPPDGVAICDTWIDSHHLTLLPDGEGGAFVWWMEGNGFLLTRVTSQGKVAKGWPSRGRRIGAPFPAGALPIILADGRGGVYAAWSSLAFSLPDFSSIQWIHVDGFNQGAGGAPSTPIRLTPVDPVATWDLWPAMTLSEDGGVFVAWATWSEDGDQVPSVVRLRRLTSDGRDASAWSSEGVVLAAFDGAAFHWEPLAYGSHGPIGSGLALAPDGKGGVFALAGLPYADPYETYFRTWLLRRSGNGAVRDGWPADGVQLNGVSGLYGDSGPDASFSMERGTDGLLYMGLPTHFDHGSRLTLCAVRTESVQPVFLHSAGVEVGGGYRHDFALSRAGGLFAVECAPLGNLYGPSPLAHIYLSQAPKPPGWADLRETQALRGWWWYGDVALAESGDGGMVLYWSQVRERLGLFAKLFPGSAPVTGVGPGPSDRTASSSLRIRFEPGEGIRASLDLEPDESGQLELFDVGGRRLATLHATAGENTASMLLPGTRDLPAGMCFGRFASGSRRLHAKVFVAR